MPRSQIQDADRDDVAQFIERYWHSRMVMSRGRTFYPHEERAFIERRDGAIVAVLSYHVGETDTEILTLNSSLEGKGIGSALMLDAIEQARKDGSQRIWLTTTNANLRAIGFYQRLGFRMVSINLGAVDEARKTKPQIPEVGERGVPMRDEIVMELPIKPYLES